MAIMRKTGCEWRAIVEGVARLSLGQFDLEMTTLVSFRYHRVRICQIWRSYLTLESIPLPPLLDDLEL